MRNIGLVLVWLVVWLTCYSFLALDYSALNINIYGAKWDIDFINNAGNLIFSGLVNLTKTFKYIIEGDLIAFLGMIQNDYINENSIAYTLLDMLIIIFNGIYVMNELTSVLLGAFTGWLRKVFSFLT